MAQGGTLIVSIIEGLESDKIHFASSTRLLIFHCVRGIEESLFGPLLAEKFGCLRRGLYLIMLLIARSMTI